MPNWKKVIVSGSDAILSDVTIDDWGSVSSSLASIETTGTSQTLQEVTDNGSTTTNVISVPGITINTTASQDFLKLGFQAGENVSNSALLGDGGVIIGTNALGSFNGSTEKVTIVGNYTADQPTTFGDLVTLVGSTIASGTNRNVGDRTTAVGAQALNGLTGGNEGNTAIGTNALHNFKGGNWNVALGYFAGPQATLTGSEGIYIGKNAGARHNSYNVPPSQSIYIGTDAKSTFGSSYGAPMTVNEIVIGNNVSGSGTNTVTIGNSSTTNNYFFGDIDADDITIDNWGSISASLASIESTGSSQTLQQVTDNGNTTTNDIIVSGSITISGDDENLTLTGGSGSIETDHTTTFSAKKTIPNNNIVTIFSVSQETYVGGVVEYTFFDSNRDNMRSGIVTMVANDTATRHSELVTTDIGNTDNLEIQVVLTDSGFGMRVNNNTGSSFTAVCNVKVLKE